VKALSFLTQCEQGTRPILFFHTPGSDDVTYVVSAIFLLPVWPETADGAAIALQ